VLHPVIAGAPLGQLDLIWRRVARIDRKIAVIDFLGPKRWKRKQENSKANKTQASHKAK
jgi:hypothetical protein